MQTITVRDLRDRLRDIIDTVKGGQPVAVGSHGAPEVLISKYEGSAFGMSPNLLETLLSGAVTSAVHYSCCGLKQHAPVRGEGWHPGDPFGRVLSWVWGRDREQAAMLVANLLAEIRNHNPHTPDPRISFDDVLWGVRVCLPNSVTGDEREEMVAFLREKVPAYYGADTQSP